MKRLFACIALSGVLGTFGAAQFNESTVNRLITEGKDHNQAGATLKELTSKFGHRRTGSRSILAAQQWAMQKLRSYGWKNVHLEQWGEIPIGFERGPVTPAQMFSPFHYSFDFASPAWSAGTNGPVRAEAIICPESPEKIREAAESLKGKWVVMRDLVSMRGSRRPDKMSDESRKMDAAAALREDIELELDKIPIAGRVFGESEKRNWLHTHGKFAGLDPQNLPKDVRVNIRFRDHRLLMNQLKTGEKMVLEFDVNQKFFAAKMPLYNVVAELPGTEKANEMVIFGGHFDSWDPPRSQGASDNGTGSTISMEAARLLAKTHATTLRTLRIILFSGEEQGLLGSSGDVKILGDGARKTVQAMVNEDGGSNWWSGVSGLPEWKPALERVAALINRAFPDKPFKVTDTPGAFPRGAGTDHASYLAKGIPGFQCSKAGPQQYGYIWHTTEDRFENTVPEGIVQMSTGMSLFVYSLANEREMLWRPDVWPVPTSETKRSVGSAPEDDLDHDH